MKYTGIFLTALNPSTGPGPRLRMIWYWI